MPLPLEKKVRSATGRGASADSQPLPTRSTPSDGRDDIGLVGQHVHDHVGRRPTGGLGKHIGHALQVLVVDHLVDAGRLPSAQLGQRNQLTGAAFDVNLRQIGRAGPPIDGKPQLDAQRIALGLAPHQPDRAASQQRLQRAGDLLAW